MKQFRIFFALVFIFLLFTNCDPNDSNGSSQNDNTFVENFGATASRDFIGQVVSADNIPLQNVAIKIGTSTVQTDVNGVFIINGAVVHERFAYITAKKTGYIDGSRSIVPTTGKNNVKIMLLPSTLVETIQSGTTSEVSIYSGTKVVFDGAFQDDSGAAYTGPVQVALFHLTPSDENIDKLMPGMLYAQTETNQEAVLETYGMLNVELRGSTGQKLNIASGHTAEITLRIDDSQIATAPSSIPLWHFDEEKGYWKEDGLATKVGNKYVGEVSHFSWWNCDMPNSTILLTFNFVDNNGNPLSNLYINWVNSAGYHANGVTDNNGQLSGILPANQIFTLNIQPPFIICGTNNNIYSTTIGPFTSDTILPNFVVNSANVMNLNVIGALLKCDNSNVTNGYLVCSNENGSYFTNVTNGTFSFSTLACNSDTSFNLQGYDYDEQLSTGTSNHLYTFPLTDVGNLIACSTNTGPPLNGLYTVVVTRDDGVVRTYTDEVIVNIFNNYFKTSTTGTYAPGTIAADQGYNFNYNFGYLTIPQQGLAQNSYNNLVTGIVGSNGNDGQIIDNNHFVTNYEISFAAGNRTYTNVYTRNN